MDLHELRNLIAGQPDGFSSIATPAAPFIGQHHSFLPSPGPEQYGMLVVGSSGGSGDIDLPPPPPLPPPPGTEGFGFFETAFGGGQRRWPRQETLTLLEVRARLDSKFREAAHKGPLWDEVSRIMAEEHGYQRSGKKCREKLENLYKYYKKTKEGKAGRQDGKHYRFFRQLEALYGGSSNGATTEINQPCSKAIINASSQISISQEALQLSKLSGNISLSNSTEFSESSSTEEEEEGKEEEDGSTRRTKTGRKSWKSKVEEFIDAQIKRFVEVQETWMNEMLKTLEHMEQARISREEDWRRQEAARFDREHGLWAAERAWTEARDAAIIQALEKISHRRDLKPNEMNDNESDENSRWPEHETASLMEIRNSLEAAFRERRSAWEEVAAAMACLGYDRSAKRCKERWEEIIDRCSRKGKECGGKKRCRKNATANKEGWCSEEISGGHEEGEEQVSDRVVGAGLGLTDTGVANGVSESAFLFPVGDDEESLWGNNNGERHSCAADAS